ncbi:MAG: iron-containing redox enzyme family protein [Marmoricola sp.]
MLLPRPRGPLSERTIRALGTGADIGACPTISSSPIADQDAQLALWTLYELHYRGFDDVPAEREWDPELIRFRSGIEHAFETELRRETAAFVEAAPVETDDFPSQLLALVDAADGPPLAAYLQRQASHEQLLEFLRQRSIFHLKESDPHSFVLARVDGPTKAALAELQYDEYGAGRAAHLHATMFGDALEGCGLDRTYGSYIDEATAETLAVNNLASLLCLHRRLRGAALGQIAAFEATSSVPSRRIAGGIARLGLPAVVSGYFEEHVEADAVHEQLAARDICGSAVTQDPTLREDVLFGAAACLHVDAVAAGAMLAGWSSTPAAQQVS